MTSVDYSRYLSLLQANVKTDGECAFEFCIPTNGFPLRQPLMRGLASTNALRLSRVSVFHRTSEADTCRLLDIVYISFGVAVLLWKVPRDHCFERSTIPVIVECDCFSMPFHSDKTLYQQPKILTHPKSSGCQHSWPTLPSLVSLPLCCFRCCILQNREIANFK